MAWYWKAFLQKLCLFLRSQSEECTEHCSINTSFSQSLRYLETSIISLISLKSTTFSMTLFYIFINSYVKKKNYPFFFSSGMVKELHVCFPMFTWLAIDNFKLKINFHSFSHTNKQILSQQIKIKIDIEIDISNRTLRHRELY